MVRRSDDQTEALESGLVRLGPREVEVLHLDQIRSAVVLLQRRHSSAKVQWVHFGDDLRLLRKPVFQLNCFRIGSIAPLTLNSRLIRVHLPPGSLRFLAIDQFPTSMTLNYRSFGVDAARDAGCFSW